MGHTRQIVAIFLVLIGALITGGFSRFSSPNREKQWSVSLAGNSDWSAAKKTIDINSYRPSRVEFTDDKTIVVTFMHSLKKPEPERQSSFMEPVFFEALFFDARDGHLRGTLQWQARRDAGEFQPVHDGGFLVHAGDKIMRYSPDLKPVRERDLTPPAEADEKRSYLPREWRVYGVPGGRTAVSRFHEERESTDTWMDTDTLEDIFSDKPQYGGNSLLGIFADDARLASKNIGAYPNQTSQLLLWERGKGWREIVAQGAGQTFLANNLLLLCSFRRDCKVINRNGEIIFQYPLTQADPSNLLVKRNLDGTRFAINDTHRAIPIIQKHDFFDWNFEAKVGDVNQRKLVADIGLGTHDARQIDLALSPDGSQLAVLAESTVTLYRLP